MTKISAVIITKNEEKNIGRCLNSLQGVADEIIVVDSYSKDKTKQICQEYNVNFAEKEFIDFSSSKNYGNKLAQFPFILSLDADEELSKELKDSILQAKGSLKADGYTMNRLTNYCGKWIYNCGWYPDRKLRLVNNEKSEWREKIHETLHLNSENIEHLQGDLLHYSYPSISKHAEKMNLFTDMGAQRLFARKKKPSLLKLIIAPQLEFLKKFIIQKGFLDGYQGFIVSMMSAYYKFYKYAKLNDLWRQQK